MRKSLAVILLTTLLLPFIGSYSWVEYHRYKVRKAIKRSMIAGIDPEELVLLKFSVAEADKELRWEHAREFEYKNEMYDVVNLVQEGDSIFFRCWWDHEETALNRSLDHLLARALGDEYPDDQQHSLVLQMIKMYHTDEGVIVPAGSATPAIWCTYAGKIYELDKLSRPGPPPRS